MVFIDEWYTFYTIDTNWHESVGSIFAIHHINLSTNYSLTKSIIICFQILWAAFFDVLH